VLPDASSILATSTISKKNGAALAPFFVAFAGPSVAARKRPD